MIFVLKFKNNLTGRVFDSHRSENYEELQQMADTINPTLSTHFYWVEQAVDSMRFV